MEAAHVETGETMEFAFDRLLIATGVKARMPDIPGTDLKNVFSVLSLQDALRIQEPLARRSASQSSAPAMRASSSRKAFGHSAKR